MDRLRLVAVDWSSIGIGAAIALVSAVAIAWFFFWLQQRRASPRLAYQIRHTLVVGSSRSATSQIEIRYRGTVVPRVTRSEVVIWNAGHATFDGKNAAENDPPRVAVAGGAKVLDAAITRTTRDVIDAEFDLTARPNDVDYTFDFLDPRDGFTLDIL